MYAIRSYYAEDVRVLFGKPLSEKWALAPAFGDIRAEELVIIY